MALENVLTKLEEIRSKMIVSVRDKGVSVPEDSTLYTIDANIRKISQGGSGTKYYKCAAVDTANKTWSGYELVLQDGVYVVSDTLTEGLTYTGYTPNVDCYYNADTTLTVQDPVLVSPTDMSSYENNEWLLTESGHAHEAYCAFNGATKQYIGYMSPHYTWYPHWIQWQNKTRKVKITSYSMQAVMGNDWESLNRFPGTWELQGSDDGNSWKKVDERSNFGPVEAAETYSFECQSPDYYYYYRLYMTDSVSPGGEAYAYIGQIKAYGSFEEGV